MGVAGGPGHSVDVDGNIKVFEVGDVVAPGGRSISLRKLAQRPLAKGKFQRCRWRDGTKNELVANFAMVRLVPCRDTRGNRARPARTLWLLIQWRNGEAEPANYFFSNPPDTAALPQLVHITMHRWKTERVYEYLKGELGPDDYEGSRFPGWHHHVTVARCSAFLVSERLRRFARSAAGTMAHQANDIAA